MLCIANGNIHDMVSREPFVGSILVEDGRMLRIGADVLPPEGCTVIDASGREVYPGFIDAHSHLGIQGTAVGYEGQDYNEYNDAVTPQLRGIDSFNPLDPAVRAALHGGVTCVATGPGSSNVLGGTFVAVKTLGRCADTMVVRNPIAMKCAFGENPKRCYQDKGISARMTTAGKLRETLLRTQDYMLRKEAAGEDVLHRPAYDMKLEAMIPVVKGELPLKAHAHQANDILTAIRIAKEFGVRMTLEHCTEGHLVAEEIAASGFPCAVGPTFGFASKHELQHKSWETPAALWRAGAQVSIITDAQVILQENLLLCASFAAKAGMDPFEAMKAITINPARHIGIADRVGSLEAGKDADILIFDGDPLKVESRLLTVMVDGKIVED
ncbi:MAG: amidohydrolase [Eubacteriales bacterium]|nr:amidohydrolase [Eubacteriales bacterium]